MTILTDSETTAAHAWETWDAPTPEPEAADLQTGARALTYGLLLAGAAWVVILAALYAGVRLLEPLLKRAAGS